MACLIEVETKRCYPLGATTIIGRGDTSQIRIDDPMVSQTHAAVERAPDGGFQIRDLGSRRGTFVGSRKVSEAPLRDGDELLIGPVRLRFENDVAEASSDSSASEREELRRLRAVVELGRSIGVEHELDRLLERVLDTCFELLSADRGGIVIYQPGSKSPFLTITRSRAGEDDVAVSTSVLGQVMVSHEPYLRTEVDSDAVLQRSESLTSRGVRSVMAVPLRYEANETEWLGVILLDSTSLANVFGPRDLELLEAIAGPTALAIKNAMLVRQVRSVISDEWRRLERVVRDLPLGVVVLDHASRCVLVNQWATARAAELGAEPGAVIEAIAGVPCDKLAEARRPLHVTTESDRLLAITASALGEGQETVIVINDLTEERERQAQAAHRDRVELVGQLAGGIAHDFNNLLHVIITYSNMLEESLEDPDQRDDAHQITHAAKSAAELTRQLLTYSRRELVRPTVVDVPDVVHGMEKLMQRTLGPQIDLVVRLAPRIPRIVMDPAQLEQILMNLVINARDAMLGRGRIEIAVRTLDLDASSTRALPPGRYVELEVADDGPGMPPEVMARIFEPYFTTKPRGKGTGLGLATVHGIVLQAHGDILVESQPGRGTTFRVLVAATDQPTGQLRTFMASTPAGAGTVLVVDDDDHVRRVTERMLRSAGYTVLSASSATAALELLVHESSVDLLLTDIVMPGMSGRDLARELESTRPALRVMFMSGYHQHAPFANGQFIAKPFRRSDLLDKIRDVLGGAAPWPVG
jgi:signal transduction histidine kinase